MFPLLTALLPTANVSYIYTRVVVRFLGPVCLQLPPSSARFGWGGNVSGLAGTACTIHQQSSRLRDCLLTRHLSCVPVTGDCWLSLLLAGVYACLLIDNGSHANRSGHLPCVTPLTVCGTSVSGGSEDTDFYPLIHTGLGIDGPGSLTKGNIPRIKVLSTCGRSRVEKRAS